MKTVEASGRASCAIHDLFMTFHPNWPK